MQCTYGIEQNQMDCQINISVLLAIGRKSLPKLIFYFLMTSYKSEYLLATSQQDMSIFVSVLNTEHFSSHHHALPSTNSHRCCAYASKSTNLCRQLRFAYLYLQLLVSTWARTRFVREPSLVASSLWNEVEEIDNNESSSDHGLADRPTFWPSKAKKAFHYGMEERRKKYLGEPLNFQGGHSLQGLWAMPGRR